MGLVSAFASYLRGIDPSSRYKETAQYAGFLQAPTSPAPDAGPLVETDQISAVVSRCINVISEDCAHVPLRLFDIRGNSKTPKEVDDHAGIKLWHHINPLETPTIYLQQLFADLLTEGNHFAWVDLDGDTPVNIIRIPPEQVTVVPDKTKIVAGYIWKAADSREEFYSTKEIIHVRTRNPASIYRGMGFLVRLREQILFDRSLRQFKLSQINNGVPTTLIFEVNKPFPDDDQFDRFSEDTWKRTKGVQNAGKPVFVKGGEVKVTPIPRASEPEILLLQHLKYTRNEIAMMFGVPPSRLSDYGESFRASATEQSRSFWQDTIMAWHRLFVDYLNSCFLPKWFPGEIKANGQHRYRFAYDYSQIRALALSMRDMATVNEILVRNAMRTPSDASVSVGDAASDDPAAHRLYLNGKPLGEPEPAPAEQPAPEEPPGDSTQPQDERPGPGDSEDPAETQPTESEQAARLRLVTRGANVKLESMWLASAGFTRSESDGAESRRVYGVASTATVDRQGTIVDQESLANAAKAYKKRNGKIFYNHNWTIPIGRAFDVEAENGRLLVGAEIGKGYQVPVGPLGLGAIPVDDIWSMIEQRMLTSYSIAFNGREIRDSEDDENGPARIEVKDLFEISVVSIPANPDAEFSLTKASDDPVFVRMLRGETEADPRDLVGKASAYPAAAVAASGSARFEIIESDNETEWSEVLKGVEQWRLSLRSKS